MPKIRVGLLLDRICQSGRLAWAQSKKATIAPSRTCGHILRIRSRRLWHHSLKESLSEYLKIDYWKSPLWFHISNNSSHFVITAWFGQSNQQLAEHYPVIHSNVWHAIGAGAWWCCLRPCAAIGPPLDLTLHKHSAQLARNLFWKKTICKIRDK